MEWGGQWIFRQGVSEHFGVLWSLLSDGGPSRQWSMYLDTSAHVWVPEVKLPDGSFAWDWIDFYKDLAEGPVPLRWAGDWDGKIRALSERGKKEARQ